MKRILTIALFALLSTSTFSQKTAHINTIDLINQMPEKAAAEEELKILQIETEYLLQELVQKYTTLGLEIEQNGESWSAVILQMKKNELLRLEQTIQDARILAEKEFAHLEEELVAPILEKAMEAIQIVADRNGYEYVVDTSLGNVLISPDKHNILFDVLKELGL